MRSLIAAAGIFVLICSAAHAEATTRDRLKNYGKDLSEAWEKYATEAQKVARQQTMQDLTTTFQKEIAQAPTPNEKISQCFKAFLDSMERANDLFRLEKMQTEKKQYLTACATAFKREYQKATDAAETRTTQKLFEMTLEMLEQTRDTFNQEKNKEQRTTGFSAINQMFSDLLRNAQVPEKTDHAAQLDANIKECKSRFPISNKALQDKNQAAYTVAEAAAKQVKQRSLQK